MAEVKISTEFGPVSAYLNHPEGAKGAVIVIHEVWGLNPHTRSIADRLATQGYAALAPDLLESTGITEKISPEILARVANPETRDEAQKQLRGAMAPIYDPEFGKQTVARLQACFNYLYNDLGIEKIAVMGYCFGGTYSFALATVEPKLAAAIIYYGHAPGEDQLANIECPVYGFYGEDDVNLVKDLPHLAEVMDRLGNEFAYTVYPDTGHAFFNDTNKNMYREFPAKDSWEKVKTILSELIA